MKIEQIRRALEIYNTGSINRAAQNLYMAQSSLSSSLHALESELGTEIFSRTQNGIALTPFGASFIEHAKEIIKHVDQIEFASANASQADHAAPGLQVGVYYLLFASHAWTWLCNKYRYERIGFNYMERTRSEIINMVANGKAEIGLLMMQSVDREKWLSLFSTQGIEYISITVESPYAVIGPNSEFYRDATSLTPARLANRKMIIFPEENELLATIDRKIFRQFSPSSYLSVCDRGSLIAMLNETGGYYLGTFNRKAYSRVPYYDNMRCLPVNGADFHYEIGYVKLRDHELSAIACEYLDMVKKLVQ